MDVETNNTPRKPEEKVAPRKKLVLSIDVETYGANPYQHALKAVGMVLAEIIGDGIEYEKIRQFRVSVKDKYFLPSQIEARCMNNFWNKWVSKEVKEQLENEGVDPTEMALRINNFLLECDALTHGHDCEIVGDYHSFDMVFLSYHQHKYLPGALNWLGQVRHHVTWVGVDQNAVPEQAPRFDFNTDSAKEMTEDQQAVDDAVTATLGPKTHLPDKDAERNVCEKAMLMRLRKGKRVTTD
jgi:hypothetical protein